MPRFGRLCSLAALAGSLGGAEATLPRCAVTAVDTENVEIVISGSDSSYVACGFGGATMDGTYAIVVKADGDVIEDKLGVPFMLGAMMEGSELLASVVVSSVESSGGSRTTTLLRSMVGASPDHHTFAVGHVPILKITGKSAWPSYPAEVKASTLTLAAPPGASRRLSGGPTVGDISSAPITVSAGAFAVLAATSALMVE